MQTVGSRFLHKLTRNNCLNFAMAPTRVSRRSRASAIEALKINKVDLLKQDNEPKHHTSEYESDELVVRRGFPFSLMLTLSRKPEENETLAFELRIGGRPMVHHGSLIPLPKVDPRTGDDVNGYKIVAASGNIMTIEVYTSATTTGIGQWLLAVRVYRNGRRGSLQKVTDDIIILFNPWAKLDPVYMPNDSWKDEYVLNEDGMQFFGSSFRIGHMDWYFGQFEKPVMKACLKLLHMGYLRYADHSDPVMVTRHFSGLVNSNDDDGVLVGNWSGDYDDGKSPTYWNGSVAILKQFVDTGEPVKYGQCWVFSGVLTAVLRCVGIPCRSLTTFESAHDTDGNLTIDYHYDAKGKPLENDDSIWNFHVWNDAWMARPLLPEGFGGWQAVDATPQEESGGKFQCGPASVAAIKQGQINFPYDMPFVYAEVNGSKRYWQKLEKPERTSDGKLVEWENVGSETDLIGQHISTKALGAFKREDITNKYKHSEGTPEEEISFKHARKYVKFTKVVRKDEVKLVEIHPSVPSFVQFGKEVAFKIKVKNISKKSLTIFLSVVGKVMQYNGAGVGTVYDRDFSKEIGASKMDEFTIQVPVKSYLGKVKGNDSIKFSFLSGIQNERQTFAGQKVVDFDRPSIRLEVGSAVKLLKPVKVKLSFTNPLSVALEKGEFRIEGAGIKDTVVKAVPTVKANSVCSVEVSVVPRKLGSRRILVGFSSKQLDGLRGAADIKVI